MVTLIDKIVNVGDCITGSDSIDNPGTILGWRYNEG